MTAEGRIQSAARWIRGAYGLMASAVGKTDVGYDKSRWQRIGQGLNAHDPRVSRASDARPMQTTD